MTAAGADPLESRINDPGCEWDYSADCVDAVLALKDADSAAHSMMQALIETAYTHGLPASGNANASPLPSHPTHRAPVGEHVLTMKLDGYSSNGFTSGKPMPWTGELIVEGSESDIDHRLYFIEGRPTWNDETDLAVGGDMCSKGVALKYDWSKQTQDICRAMHKGISVCKGRQRQWRRWN